MTKLTQFLLISFLVAVFVTQIGFGLYVLSDRSVSLGGYENYNTFDRGVTQATSTINTTSTQVFASVTQMAVLVNPTTATITCSLDDLGTTAASSTATANRGVIVGPHNATTTTSMIPSVVQFGECYPGSYNCIPFKGAVNCVASAQAVVTKVTK